MNTLLLTGFEPWGAAAENSSWEILKDACVSLPDGWQCRVHQLPVSWRNAPRMLEPLLTPDVKAVICFGMHAGADKVLIERIAVNLTSPGAPDGNGHCADSEYVIDGAPPAYWTKLPFKALRAALAQKQIPCGESQSAGNYLCNYTFYWLMHYIVSRRPDITGGFIHVPALDRDNQPMCQSLHAAIPIIARTLVASITQ